MLLVLLSFLGGDYEIAHYGKLQAGLVVGDYSPPWSLKRPYNSKIWVKTWIFPKEGWKLEKNETHCSIINHPSSSSKSIPRLLRFLLDGTTSLGLPFQPAATTYSSTVRNTSRTGLTLIMIFLLGTYVCFQTVSWRASVQYAQYTRKIATSKGQILLKGSGVTPKCKWRVAAKFLRAPPISVAPRSRGEEVHFACLFSPSRWKIYAAIFLPSTSGMKNFNFKRVHPPPSITSCQWHSCLKTHTVDGRLDKTSQMKLVVYPVFYKNWYIPVD